MPFSQERFKPKSTLNPRNKDDIIETYLIYLEERLLGIGILPKRINSLTRDERNAMYNLKGDKSIIKVLTRVRQWLFGTPKVT